MCGAHGRRIRCNSAASRAATRHPRGQPGSGVRIEMRAIVTCECCGHRQTVARPIRKPEHFYLVCHECERSLKVEVSAEDISAAETAGSRTATQVG